MTCYGRHNQNKIIFIPERGIDSFHCSGGLHRACLYLKISNCLADGSWALRGSGMIRGIGCEKLLTDAHQEGMVNGFVIE